MGMRNLAAWRKANIIRVSEAWREDPDPGAFDNNYYARIVSLYALTRFEKGRGLNLLPRCWIGVSPALDGYLDPIRLDVDRHQSHAAID